MTDALGSTLAYLAAAAATDETGTERQLGSLRECDRDLRGWVEAAED